MKAALQSDEDEMARKIVMARRLLDIRKAGKLKNNVHPKHLIDYKNSPPPPRKNS